MLWWIFMYYSINNLKMYYEYYDNHKDNTIIFLHGWARSSVDFINYINKFDANYLLIDFIGFGKSDKTNKKRSLKDYVDDLKTLIDYLKLDNIILIGHSFGGRVAIYYSYLYSVNKLILVSSAGIKPKRKFDYYLKVIKYKTLKKFKFILNNKSKELLENMGSGDYKKLNKIERQTFSKIVNFDQVKHLKHIKTKTLILFGVKDKTVLFRDGEIMNKLLVNSKLIPFYKSGHFLFQTEDEKFINVILRFINDQMS